MKAVDEQLMARVVTGDEAALETLYDRYAPSVLGVVLRIVPERAVAEEIVQEAFWRVWHKAEGFDAGRGKFTTWLFSIARRLAIDTIRRQKVRPQAARGDSEEERMRQTPDETADVAETAVLHLEQERVRSALAVLSPEQFEVIELAYFQGLTRQEIAQVIETPLGTVHTRARLGLQKLRQALNAAGRES